MLRVVVDTNVIVSGLLSDLSPPAVVVNMILNSEVLLVYCDFILFEYREVLKRKRFGFDPNWVDWFVSFLEASGERVYPTEAKGSFPDEGDEVFYETAITADADFLITGNKKHFPKRRWIVSPREFLTRDNI